MTHPIPPEKMAVYRRPHQRRGPEERGRQAERRERAMTPAPEAGGMPRTRPGIRSVGLFGSLARSTAVDHRSDVDVAVTGGAGGTGLFAGVANPLELDPEIEVALVMLETARPTLAPPIGAEGISL